jgi:hypothetical protein
MGAINITKSKNNRPVLSDISIFGKSPTIVDAPPIFDAIISAMTTGTGLIFKPRDT